MATKKYRVWRTWECSGWDEVEAESRDEAEDKMDLDETPLPENGDYVGGSCEVDRNITEEFDPKTNTWVEAKD